MAVGWAHDAAVQDQIDASVEDAVKLARSRMPDGEGSTHCECKLGDVHEIITFFYPIIPG